MSGARARTAIVVGGGIAGPVLAVALQRAGIAATVHEAYAAPAGDVGAWLGVQVNGLDALRAIGADQPVLRAGVPTPRIEFRSGTGKVLGGIDTTGGAGAGGAPAPAGVSLKRSELYRVLHGEALRRGVEVRYGSRLVGARRTAEGVRAEFDDGSTATADVLVGADGVRSTVRTLLDAGAAPPRFVPILNLAGYSEHVPAGAEPGRLTMVFGRRAFFGYLATPGGRTWWFANPPLRAEPRRGELEAGTDARWRALLADSFAGDRSPALELVAATPEPLRAWATYDLPTVRTWHDERTVLLGDAAHATSPAAGQGASQAVEDAVVLARCLRDLPVPLAFEVFERTRRARVERVVAAGWRTSAAKSPGAVGRVARDAVMPLVLRAGALRGQDQQAWMRRHHVEWDAPALPRAGAVPARG
ncbi:FAD-dependent oxidoreductase [Kineococcus indalonis]|uniref:FAD-dependent oxidoreductase n=1 Tax=Kineococcus indalonis TaxID=2696566 RepID=UPI001412E0A9|nr:NAD(P)/FAD-dependent oxidoreductase [Kineococcus indalonis]NAZ85356.1 FAD-dependent monooxygenase [Kineococcus indalonis]